MNADLVELGGWLLSAWGLGYGMGFLIYTLRRISENI